jgi:hypothetical protein
VALGLPAAAQESQSPALEAELKQLGTTAQSLQQDLPSFTCTERAVSQVIKKSKVKRQVQFVAEVRAERVEGRLDEQLEVSQVNGKTPAGSFDPPFMVGGGFAQSLGFFLPATQGCFEYKLSPGRIDFRSPPGEFDRPECKEKGAPSGFALLDQAGNPTHLERRVPPEYAPQVHVVDFAAMDFAATELDGKLYPLTAKVVAEVPKEDGVTLHFAATFTGCHLFKATSRILPDVTPVPESNPAAPKR